MMRQALRRGIVVLAGAGALAGAVLPTQAAAAASPPGWRAVKTYPASSSLNGVAATAASDAFIVGSQSNADGTTSSKPMIAARWNGKAWLTLPQLPVAKGFQLNGGGNVVAASSASNAWVFAGTSNSSPADYTVAQRWNGKAWVTQSVFPAWVAITSAVTSSPSDAWAFGQVISPFATYAAHYNGHKWTRESFPIVPAGASALSGSDVYVVGEPPGVSAASGKPADFVVEHYTKGKWSKLPAPSFTIPKGDGFSPTSIVADSDTNVWAVAQLSKGEGVAQGSVLLHYNGHAWKRVTVPYAVTAPTALAQDGAGGFWLTAQYTKAFTQYFIHDASNGKWTSVAVPHGKNVLVAPGAIAWIPGTKSLWSAATQFPDSSGPARGIILKYGV
jgi:hypothetical protein